MSTIGSRIGKPPTLRSTVRSALPPTTSDTSVEVPPMSKAIALSIPARASRRGRRRPAGGRSGDEDERRMGCGVFRAHDAAGRAHDERFGQPRRAARFTQRPEVAAARRPEIRVGGDGRGALVLAELRRDLVRGDDVRRGVATAAAATARSCVGSRKEEEADGDRLAVDRRAASRGRAASARHPVRCAR